MADLRPLGSEKLQGMDKINRILEIARYNEPSNNINENKSDYTIQLADGNFYGIVHEKNGYIVKKSINESEMEYIEPMKNRKYHKSYSQAMKKLNLLAGELNRIHENKENIALIGEEKKFVLKTPKSETPPSPAPEPAPAPAPDAGMSDLGGDVSVDTEGGEDLDLDLDLETPEGGEDLDLNLDTETEPMGDEEEVSFKSIQKITGKLGQKLRSFDEKQGLTSENIKYVLNSVISAIDLENLTEEDLEDVLSNFEEEEIDYGMEGDVDVDAGSEDELDLDLDFEEEPVADEELGEGESLKTMMDEIFAESKVEKVISKYYDISEDEKKDIESKKVQNYINESIQRAKVKNEIKEMSETFEQENTTSFIMSENKNAKFVGKTNVKNLVVEIDGKQLKINTKGELI